MEAKSLTGGGRLLMLRFVVLAALLAGCSAFGGQGDESETPGGGTSGGSSNPTPPPIIDPSSKSLRLKFGISTRGAAGVSETFNTVHNYLIYTPNLQENGAGGTLRLGEIALGDYIDLEGGLHIEQYVRSGTNPPPDDESASSMGNSGYLDTENVDVFSLDGQNGTLLRLIVVGINSFKDINDNGTEPHLVFQFMNIPSWHRMNPTNTTAGGYQESEMREYLVPVDGRNNSGVFLAGLENAGVPMNILWAPIRKIWRGTGYTAADSISDKLWIPTEYEMFGSNISSNSAYENAANQGRLQYYDSDAIRMKYNPDAADVESSPDYEGKGDWCYWLSSPLSNAYSFCLPLRGAADAYSDISVSAQGCVPAFCVK